MWLKSFPLLYFTSHQLYFSNFTLVYISAGKAVISLIFIYPLFKSTNRFISLLWTHEEDPVSLLCGSCKKLELHPSFFVFWHGQALFPFTPRPIVHFANLTWRHGNQPLCPLPSIDVLPPREASLLIYLSLHPLFSAVSMMDCSYFPHFTSVMMFQFLHAPLSLSSWLKCCARREQVAFLYRAVHTFPSVLEFRFILIFHQFVQ